MPRRHWLVKSEPFKYSFELLVREGRTVWDGVRNFEARNNLRAMAQGDLLLFYHSNEGLAVVGIARVAREAYPDPSAPDEDWSVVDIEPLVPMPKPVPLTSLREAPALASMAILRRSRLSVTPVTPAEFEEVLRLGKADPRAIERAAERPSPAKTASAEAAPAGKVAKAAKATPASKALSKALVAKAPATKRASVAKAPAAKRAPVAKASAAKRVSATKAPKAKKTSATKAPAAKKTSAAKSAAKAPVRRATAR